MTDPTPAATPPAATPFDAAGAISAIGGGLLRHGLTTASGGLVAQGLITGDQQQQLVGALMALAGVALSIAEKFAARRFGVTPPPGA